MMKALFALLLFSGLAWVHSTDVKVEEGDVVVKMVGKSGKIMIRQKDKEFNSTDEIVVEMDSLMEVDSDGKFAGKGSDHKVNSFANQEFALSGLSDKTYSDSGLKVKQVTFTTSNVANLNATLKVMLYIFKQAGDIVNDDEVTQVKEGTVKFNIELEDWKFCNGSSSDCSKVGDAVEFVIVIKSKGKPEKKDRKKSAKKPGKKQAANYELGNGAIQLSSKVEVDGKFTNMSSPYPKYEAKNKKQTFTFRFPKFTSKVVYDPAIDLTVDSGANGGKTGSMLNLLLVALSLAVARFLA